MNQENASLILKEVTSILKEQKLNKIGLIQGTLLGIFRDQTILEWDHDIDLLLFDLTDEAFNELYTFFKDKGFTQREHSFLENRFFSVEKDGVIVDFAKGFFEDDFFIVDNPAVTDKYPKYLFETLSSIEHNGESYLTPCLPEEYLRLCYGEYWRTPKEGDTDHDNLFERIWKI